MDEKRKKLLVFWGTIIVAVMFISSYAAVGNNNVNRGTNTTTTVAVRTYPAFGSANGIITGYGEGATLLLNSSINSTTGNQIVNLLSNLEANGSINSYIELGNSFQVLLGSTNAYDLEQLVRKQLNLSNSVSVNATSTITLPSAITLYVNSQAAGIRLSQRNYTVNVYPLEPIGTTVNVSIRAVITINGTIYQNQIEVTPQ